MVRKLKLKSNKELKSTFGIDKAEKLAKKSYKAAAPVMNEAFNDPDVNRAVKKAANKTSRVIKKEALPTAVSLGLPIAQMGVSGLTTYLTGNPMLGDLAGDFSGKVAKGYIPDKYESQNKYIQMLSEGIEQIPGMMSGDVDPMAMYELGNQFMGNIQNDIFKGSKKGAEDYSTPYDIQMEQMMNPYIPQYQQQPETIDQPSASNKPLSYTQRVDNISNTPTYAGDDDVYDDEITIKTTPYQQKEGSSMGLMGGRIKKKRGRPKKVKTEQIMKVEIIKQIPSRKYAGARNASLEQLLEETELKQNKLNKKQMNDLIKRTEGLVGALGFGVRPKKGSDEAKKWGQKMKVLREAKKR